MNLVIGNTSQLSYYFPKDYLKLSSRDFKSFDNYDNVYITFAEQRIYDNNIDYNSINYDYTLNIIENLIDKCNKIVCYTSCELWNNKTGYIDNNTEFEFEPSGYTNSKLKLYNKILELRKTDKKYKKVIFIHPFYFNSVQRSEYFLFGKIFKSIIDKKKITVKNLNFYRDMVHAKYVVNKSILADTDQVVGAGKLFNIRDFVIDLYNIFGLDYFDFVTESYEFPDKEKFIMAKSKDYNYSNLIKDTVEDILEYKENHGYNRFINR